jgi:DNA polymerase-3 subunit epsilon
LIGLNDEDKSCILVWEGTFYGMGYIPADAQITNPDSLKEYLTTYKENSFIRNLVNGYAARFPSKIIYLNNAGEINPATENLLQWASD